MTRKQLRVSYFNKIMNCINSCTTLNQLIVCFKIIQNYRYKFVHFQSVNELRSAIYRKYNLIYKDKKYIIL